MLALTADVSVVAHAVYVTWSVTWNSRWARATQPALCGMSVGVAQPRGRYKNEYVRQASFLVRISLALAALASLLLLVLPTGSYVRIEERIGADGERTRVAEQGRTRLLETEGGVVAFALVVPVAIALLPAALSRRRVPRVVAAGAAALLLAFVAVTGFSIGLFYLPAALAMVAAAFAPAPRSRSARA